MIEQNIKECKKCLVMKNRILAGKYPNGKDKKWVDENGNEWNGKTCPTCHKAKQREYQKRIRHLKIIE